MDNFLIIILIVCAILWWDSRKRNNATSKAWEDIGVAKNTPLYTSPGKEISETPAMSPEELMEILNSWQGITTPKQTDDEVIQELVNDVLKEISPKEIADAKSALKVLGYKDKDIKNVVSRMTGNMKSGEIVTSALRILNA